MEQYDYHPKTPTQKETLNKLLAALKVHNSILTGKYEKINTTMNDKINFKCGKCNAVGEKILTQIYVSGGICHACTQKIKMEKQEASVMKKYNVKNVSQTVVVKNKKYSTALANGYIYTKASWLEYINAKGLDEFWEYLFDNIETVDDEVQMRHIKCGNVVNKSPRAHMNQDDPASIGQGCTYCYHNSKRLTKEFIESEGHNRYGDLFNYDKIPDIIKNNHDLLVIRCAKHGEFKTTYPTHLAGAGGCLPCSNHMKTKGDILKELGEKLFENGVNLLLSDYDDTRIIKMTDKLTCKCARNSLHPIWKANLNNLMKGSSCPSCVYKTELKLYNYLVQKYPNIHRQFKLDSCKLKRHLPFDFCIPEIKTIIELDGRQHFKQVSNWGTPEQAIKRDVFKMQKATKEGYKIIRIFQEDVYNNNEAWLIEHVLAKILSEERKHAFISSVDTLYNDHIKLYTDGVEVVLSDSDSSDEDVNEIVLV